MPSRQETFEALLQSYSRLVASAIRRVCARRYQALIPDIEQEVSIALWKRLGSGKEIDHPASYLYKVALTTALSVVRKHAPKTTSIEDHREIPSAEPPGALAGLLPAERARLLQETLGDCRRTRRAPCGPTWPASPTWRSLRSMDGPNPSPATGSTGRSMPSKSA